MLRKDSKGSLFWGQINDPDFKVGYSKFLNFIRYAYEFGKF